MNLNLENGWQILPIGGDTDTAYMGIKSDQKVFLKRDGYPRSCDYARWEYR